VQTAGEGPIIIAIDGPAASGKGTLAKRIAQHFGFHCLDTGLLYRAVARDVCKQAFRLDDRWAAVAAARGLDVATLDDLGLRGGAAGDKASIVAKIPEVRAALLDYQRAFARRKPGAVVDGRDIGTVVCPDAEVKIFVTATPEVRAKRRLLELEARGEPATYDGVLAVIRDRDARDAGRASAPMRPADDAILLDTTDLDIEAAFDAAVGSIMRKIGQ
jgi:cytidylate kinase